MYNKKTTDMKRSIKTTVMVLLCLSVMLVPTQQANAGIYEIIKAAVVKAIKAADLAIQRNQNRIIWLQNAQKVLENTMSKLKLDEISDWTDKQRDQYQKYFDELRKVKLLITYYQRIRDISDRQVRLVNEYRRAWNLIQRDKHFTLQEVEYMARVYTGILNESLKNVEQLSAVVNSFQTQMSDAKRLEIINHVGNRVDENYTDLRAFNTENAVLSMQRAKTEYDIEYTRNLYGIN